MVIREKVGRPTETKSGERGQNVSLYLDPEELKELEEIRWRERKSMSNIVRVAIGEYIRNHAEGNETFKLDDWQTDPSFRAIPTLLAPDEKWMLCFENSTDEELLQLYIALKKRKVQLIWTERKRAEEQERAPRWDYDKFDIPIKNAIPMLQGEK